ncbi:MAG: hypothetical protein ACREEP_09250 [Dongiaceae bacterium]
MNQATRAAQQARHSATMRLPIAFAYPLRGIVGRSLIGAALLALGGAMLFLSGAYWTIGGAVLGLFGSLVAASNLRARIDRDRRKIVLNPDGVEIRYGFSRRSCRFLDYSEYRISRLGLRRFLTALPLEVEQALGERARLVRAMLYDRPTFITPMPLFGDSAPASLLEWQSLLNELRRAAFASAGRVDAGDRVASEAAAADSRRAGEWSARQRAGAKPTRMSRRACLRWQFVVTILFLAILLAPTTLGLAAHQLGVAICGLSEAGACWRIQPLIAQIMMIGGPVLAILVFILGSAWLSVRRAHDLDEDVSVWQALRGGASRRSAFRYRLGTEDGTPGTNRVGPAPPN